jgi:hypothetical protein
MKKELLASSVCMASAPALAACSDSQLSDKAMAVATKLEALQTKNPKAAEEISTRMVIAQCDPKTMGDTASMCESCDDTLADPAKVK